ncbi:diguanylate cyclase [Dactylosporangium aurantiacum]|uniref:Diguanylate cyclase n=1 Tax=Dactylosporangium aurantiacum TaxID=35754 RepID=A0A9Q9IIG7_9ACTN|nr:sensor domain-containing diguanylate cyclase [Dactylosporangium aurantiacum]MDG6104652.1 sensor domain-containing diguanylate cyclase [Dactylosporangium aurantiacum]UWZ56251.1 diguanylate cyclase [Dactylosporangium aurantiacum]
MRLRSWLVVSVSAALLLAIGAVGISVNRSALRAAETVHRADTLALATNNGSLVEQLLLVSAKELNDFVTSRPLSLTPGDAGDRAALIEYANKSTFFTYGLTITDLTGNPINATKPANLFPDRDAIGWKPLISGLALGRPGFSSLMTVKDTLVQAVAVPIVVGSDPTALIYGFIPVRKGQLQAYLEKLSDPSHLSLVVDSSGTVGASSDPDAVGTVVDSAVIRQLRSTESVFVTYRAGGRSMIAAVHGGLPGGWAYVRAQSTATFDGPVRNRSLTINLALLTMLLVGVAGLAVLGYRSQLVRRRAEERFAALVEHAPDVVTVLDREGAVVYSSPSGQRILGFVAVGSSVFDLLHPDDREQVRDRFAALLAERGGLERMQVRVAQADGNHRWFDFTASNQLHNAALDGIVINARDITDSREMQDRLAHDAHHDPLTGLPNRRRLQERLTASLQHTPVGVLFVDLDGFKPVNDELGHEAGDELLRQVGERLSSCLRPTDVLARVGGDEFVLLLPGVVGGEDAGTLAVRLREVLAEPFDVAGHEVRIGASVGLHLAGPGEDPDEVLRTADQAMYAAKRGPDRPGRHRAG